MKIFIRRSALIALLIFSAILSNQAQSAGKEVIKERDVRAEMEFLASDAMQGRGSGTQFERIAAEYIGSQFMQFGLEPAGEMGPEGTQTYVQSIEVAGQSTVRDLKFSGEIGGSLAKGKDFAVFSISSAKVSGLLQKLKPGDTAKPGSIVLLEVPEESKFGEMQSVFAKLNKDGAAAIILTETAEIRDHWSDISGRDPTISRRGTIIVLTKEAGDRFGSQTEGTNIELSGRIEAGAKRHTWNAMGKITGSDPTLSSEVILLTSHLDHLGVRENAPGEDKIFNGADDDASGTVAVMEMARTLSLGKKPKRTVYFVCFGSEEAGGYGARYFIDHMPFPKEKLVANLEFEMIGRPDAKVKPEELWLTGFERSDLGPELAKRGARLVQDPHPEENFFQRSDNIQLARAGIIAHTVSSFGLHTDYHHATDEVKTIDFAHMTRAINSMVKPIIWLVNSNFKPEWNEGMKP